MNLIWQNNSNNNTKNGIKFTANSNGTREIVYQETRDINTENMQRPWNIGAVALWCTATATALCYFGRFSESSLVRVFEIQPSKFDTISKYSMCNLYLYSEYILAREHAFSHIFSLFLFLSIPLCLCLSISLFLIFWLSFSVALSLFHTQAFAYTHELTLIVPPVLLSLVNWVVVNKNLKSTSN